MSVSLYVGLLVYRIRFLNDVYRNWLCRRDTQEATYVQSMSRLR
jgi:hypothetical protein